MNERPEDFEVMEVSKVEQVLRHWPLFLSGFHKVNSLCKPRFRENEETFLKVILAAMENGLILLVKKKRESIVNFSIWFMVRHPFHESILYCYMIYSVPGKTIIASKVAFAHMEVWAREHNVKEVECMSVRINGSAFSLFEKKWGLERKGIIFNKALS